MPSQLATKNTRRKSSMVALALLSTSARAFTTPARRSVTSTAFALNRSFRYPALGKQTQLCMSTTVDNKPTLKLVDAKYDIQNKEAGIGTYEPEVFESQIYKWWEDAGCFQPDAKQTKEEAAANGRESYVLPMPPPNVTGRLHMGHAIFVALQDVLARFHRMRGRPVLWLPGKCIGLPSPFHMQFHYFLYTHVYPNANAHA